MHLVCRNNAKSYCWCSYWSYICNYRRYVLYYAPITTPAIAELRLWLTKTISCGQWYLYYTWLLGIISYTSLYPLENIRTRLQVASTVPSHVQNANQAQQPPPKQNTLAFIYDIYKRHVCCYHIYMDVVCIMMLFSWQYRPFHHPCHCCWWYFIIFAMLHHSIPFIPYLRDILSHY